MINKSVGPLDILKPNTLTQLGSVWATNSVNCTTYRLSGMFTKDGTQFGCFYDASGHIVLYKRSIGDSIASLYKIDQSSPWDAHYSPALGVDLSNRIHIIGGAHVSTPFYFLISEQNGSFKAESFRLPFSDADKVSYPSFISTETGQLFLAYRVGPPGRASWSIRKWHDEAKDWGTAVQFLDGSLCKPWPTSAYFNRPVPLGGSRFGFFLVWRSESIEKSANEVWNTGIDYAEIDLSSGECSGLTGLRVPIPLTPSVAERAIAVSWTKQISNQSGATRLADGRPFGVAIWADETEIPQIYGFWPTKRGTWQSKALTSFQTKYRMEGRGTLALPHSRPDCARLADGRILVIYRSVEMGRKLIGQVVDVDDATMQVGKAFVLWNHNLGSYEPVLDDGLASLESKFSLYIQRCGSQKDGVSTENRQASSALIAEYDFSAFGR